MNNKNDNPLSTISLVLAIIALVVVLIGHDVEACELILPKIPTNVKTYTDYHCYNIDGSAQKYIQDNALTDEYGIRMFDGYYCIALGSAYGDVGDVFIVELSNGISFSIIMADEKADEDTDSTNRYHPCPNYLGEDRACVIEFIVDENKIPENVSIYGSFDYCELFHGNIKRISSMGRHNDKNISWKYGII